MLLYRGVNLKEAHLQVFVRFTFAFLMHFLFVGLISSIDFITDTFKIIITQFEVVLACRLLFSTRKLFFFFFYRICKKRPAGTQTWISGGNSSATFTTCKCSNQVQVGQTEHNHHNTNDIITYPQ